MPDTEFTRWAVVERKTYNGDFRVSCFYALRQLSPLQPTVTTFTQGPALYKTRQEADRVIETKLSKENWMAVKIVTRFTPFV